MLLKNGILTPKSESLSAAWNENYTAKNAQTVLSLTDLFNSEPPSPGGSFNI